MFSVVSNSKLTIQVSSLIYGLFNCAGLFCSMIRYYSAWRFYVNSFTALARRGAAVREVPVCEGGGGMYCLVCLPIKENPLLKTI